MECPPTFCSQPILRPGHCCPSCEDKSHSCLNGGPHSNDSSCLHFGIEYQSGQSWAMVNSCTSCDCRVPICDERVSRSTLSSSSAARSTYYTSLVVAMVLYVQIPVLLIGWPSILFH